MTTAAAIHESGKHADNIGDLVRDESSRKGLVFDTNIIIDDPMAHEHVGDNHVVIPSIVLQEAAVFSERRGDVVAQNSRRFLKEIERLHHQYNLTREGAPLEGGGRLYVSFLFPSDITDP